MKRRGGESCLAVAAGFARRWFGALQRRFRSFAPPVEWMIIVWVHVYSNLRHRLQRTHLRAETQMYLLLGQMLRCRFILKTTCDENQVFSIVNTCIWCFLEGKIRTIHHGRAFPVNLPGLANGEKRRIRRRRC